MGGYPVTTRWRGDFTATGAVVMNRAGLPSHLLHDQASNPRNVALQGQAATGYDGETWIWVGVSPLVTLTLSDAATGGQVELQSAVDPTDASSIVTIGTAIATGARVTDNNVNGWVRGRCKAITTGTGLAHIEAVG